MNIRKHAGPSVLAAAALLAVLSACGTGSTPGTAVSGTAVADGAVTGTVTLVDASSPAQQRTVSTSGAGAFVFDTKGTHGPYLLQVAGSDRSGAVTLYGVSDGLQSLDVNPLTDAAYAAAAGDRTAEQAFHGGTSDDRTQVSSGTISLLNQLKTVLAPLLQLYGIVDPFKDTAQVKLLLTDVAFKTSDGKVTVVNRATGGVIYSAPLRKITTGTFNAANMPGGPCATATAASGDGATLYAASCQSCHGPLATSQVKGKSLSEIKGAIAENEGGMGKLSGLTSAQLSAIAAALAGVSTSTCGNPTCTYAYGEWTACANGTQTRAVTSATPAGCTGTPVTSQTCTTTPPPPAACTSYTYSAWSACSNGTQTRTVATASPAGCTDQTTTPPVLSQTCTTAIDGAALYGSTCQRCHGAIASTTIKVPTSASAITTAGMTQGLSADQVTAVAAAINAANTTGTAACTGYAYSAWGTCSAAGQQTRTVTGNTPAGCAGTPTAAPVLTQSCTPAPVACTGFTLSTWSACSAAGTQTRTITGATPTGCDQSISPPALSQSCTPTCTSYGYSAWGTCSAAGQQTRTVTSTVPATCDQAGNPPVTSQACTPTPAACTGFNYSAWGTCSAAGQQTRTVASYTPAGCAGTPTATPVLSQSCTPPVVACTSYTYGAWSTCSAAGLQTRSVATASPSGCTDQTTTPPVLSQSCTPTPTCTLATAVPTCSSCHGGSAGNKAAPSSHGATQTMCATCHGPTNNGTGVPTVGMTAALSGTACVLNYPTSSSTHQNGVINRGAP